MFLPIAGMFQPFVTYQHSTVYEPYELSMSLQILIVTAILYAWAGYSFLDLNRPWMCLAFACWAVANVAMGMDSLR